MRPARPVIALLIPLAAACELGVPVTIDIQSNRRIQFTIPQEYRDNFCLVSATIYREAAGREDAVWRIRLQPRDGAPCRASFAFPHAPPDFITEIGSDHLAPGAYRVDIDGGLPQASSHFAIPGTN